MNTTFKKIAKKVGAGLLAAVAALTAIAPAYNTHCEVETSAASYQYAMFPGTTLAVTQGAYREYRAYSHDKQNAFDFGGNSNYTAPFDAKITHIDKTYNAVTIVSTNKVYLADGRLTYLSVCFTHDNNVSNLKVGQKLKQGQTFYQPGVKDPTGKTTGPHVHLAVRTGQISDDFYSGNVYPNDAFYLKSNTKISQRGGYAWATLGAATNLVNGAVYTISPKGKNLYVSAANTKNFGNVQLSNKVNNYSKWKAHYVSGKDWYFENLASGKVLDIYGNSVKAQSNTQIYSYNKHATQYFTPKAASGGYFLLESAGNARVAIDCYGSSSSLKNKSNVWTYSINYDSTQLFKFNRVK